jgi:2,4-dienoyl-CoA reductase-like NADH-dependent reductase (Old Yellow Enzyme family)
VKLFEPFDLGGLVLPNRIVMAPMTRNRSHGQVQSDWAVEHYAQRADAGLLLGEATQVSARGQSTADTPGLHSDEQEAAWRAVVDAVHTAGGRIAAQLAHAGRLTHSDYHGLPPVAPSAVLPAGFVRTPKGTKPYEQPWVPTEAEVPALVDEFAQAARRALKAGFDGVEIHGAHGFLIDQFLQSGTNHRNDAWGGDTVRRRRFALAVFEAVAGVWPKNRIGFTVSPAGNHKGIRDDDPVGTFTELARELSALGLGWLHVADQPWGDERPSTRMRAVFRGPLIVSEGYTRDTAEEALVEGRADLIAFGRAFTANPDLVSKLRSGARLELDDPKTFYSGGREGYLL